MKIQESLGEKIFGVINHLVLIAILVCTLYPCWFVLMASVSDPTTVYNGGGILLWPKKFGLYAYYDVLKYKQLWLGYRNTIFYALGGTTLSVFLTVSAAFSLSRKEIPFKNFFLGLIMVTMYFSGGLIPSYLVVKGLGILDTPFAMILPGAVSTYNLIVTLTYFRSMPYELEEAAKIDGANEYMVLWKIMLPLATPIIAVITLYYAVSMWNNFFTGLVYINNKNLYPLQLIIRDILMHNSTGDISQTASEGQAYTENIKYAVIVVSTVPILCVYPFLQKYFVKGIMIGAVKG